MRRPYTLTAFRRLVGVLVCILGLIYLVWGYVHALFLSASWGWGTQPSSAEQSVRFQNHMLPIVVVSTLIIVMGAFLCAPWKFKKWHAYVGLSLLIAVFTSFLWPVTTHVTGNTQIQLLREDGTPLVGLRAEQKWSLRGYSDKWGTEVKTSDANGTVHFPSRVMKKSVGMHLLYRGWDFAFDESSEARGPFLFINIDLPAGYWLPAGKQDMDRLSRPFFPSPTQHDQFAFPPLLYFGIENLDALHSNAWVQGRATGIAGDEKIVLIVRPASTVEARIIDDENKR